MPNLDKQDQRLVAILGTEDVPDVDITMLQRYLGYLKQHLAFPCRVTGIESFAWEENYLYEDGSEQEHARLRKTRPSCLDTYELLSLDDDVDPEDGIVVHVKRISDKKMFVLPLAILEAATRKSKNYQLLNDYAVWFTTWRD
jgi:hypothetical protein